MLLLLHKDVLEVNQLRRPSPSPDSFPTGGLSSRLRSTQLQKAKAEASHRGVSAFPGASGSCPRACRCWGLLPAQNRHRGCPALRSRASESEQAEGITTPNGGVSSSPWGLWGGGEGSTSGKHPKKQQGQETGTPWDTQEGAWQLPCASTSPRTRQGPCPTAAGGEGSVSGGWHAAEMSSRTPTGEDLTHRV